MGKRESVRVCRDSLRGDRAEEGSGVIWLIVIAFVVGFLAGIVASAIWIVGGINEAMADPRGE